MASKFFLPWQDVIMEDLNKNRQPEKKTKFRLDQFQVTRHSAYLMACPTILIYHYKLLHLAFLYHCKTDVVLMTNMETDS